MYDNLKIWLNANGLNVSSDLWEEMQTNSELIKVKKNEILIPYGNNRKDVYFVVSGSFVKSLISENGDQKAVWFHFDNLFNVAVCTDTNFLNKPTRYEISALEESTVIKFKRQTVDSWLSRYPMFNKFRSTNMITTSTTENDVRAYQLMHTPIEFLEYIDKNYPTIKARVSSKNMAQFLGVSPEWYSKMKRKV